MDTFLQDIRFALRALRKNRTLTFVAVISIALGIGANTAVFSAVNAILLRSLPYHGVENLVLVWGSGSTDGVLENRNQVSATDIADVAQSSIFESTATFTAWMPLLSGQGEAERVPGIQVGDGFFRVMKGKPLLGRTFVAEDQQEGKDFVIVLGHGLWQRKFASDPKIIGKTILMNGRPYIVVGVMPADFKPLPESLVRPRGQFYRPVAEGYDNSQRDSRHLRAVARLKPGATIAAAQAELDVLAKRLSTTYPESNTGNMFHVASLTEDTVGPLRKSLLVLFGAVTFVLLVACANVSNLLLAKSNERIREISIRASLGASRFRIIRQMLTESFLLSACGGIFGLALAYWSISAINIYGMQVHPLLGDITLDARVLAFTAAVSILCGILFGLAPALHATHPQLSQSLREAGPAAGISRNSKRLSGALVVSEIAITLTLLMCAGLFLQTVARLSNVNPGFNPRNLLTMGIGLPSIRYPEAENWQAFYTQLIERLEALPGVTAAGVTTVLPLSDNFDGRGLIIEDHPRPSGQEVSCDMYVVTDHYLRAMEIFVLRGRGFLANDRTDTQRVALVNEAMAKQIWPGVDPIGRRFQLSGPKNETWRTIVGVVKDVSQYGLDETPPAQFYLPFSQFPNSFNTVIVKGEGNAASLAAAVRNEIRKMDSQQAPFNVATMEELMSRSISINKFLMQLLIALAAVAIVMAGAGIYGLLSYNVARRTQEIGIRMALGANRRRIFAHILKSGMSLTVIGIVLGVAGSLAAGRLVAGLLFQTSPSDAVTLLVVSSVLLLVALAACLAPARRASNMQPMIAIRNE